MPKRSMERDRTRRGAIVEAMIRVAGSKGYLAASVADVLTEAGASRTTFYKYFGDKRECFLAAYDLAVERILHAAVDACEGKGEWHERTRAGLAGVVELFAGDPALARTAIVEAAAAGSEARRRHWAAIARIARLLEEEQPAHGSSPLPANTAPMAVGAVAGLILDGLREGPTGDLPQLLPELEFALLVPFIGPKEAAEAYATDLLGFGVGHD
jgi:AcrR family transcriptional regulator